MYPCTLVAIKQGPLRRAAYYISILFLYLKICLLKILLADMTLWLHMYVIMIMMIMMIIFINRISFTNYNLTVTQVFSTQTIPNRRFSSLFLGCIELCFIAFSLDGLSAVI